MIILTDNKDNDKRSQDQEQGKSLTVLVVNIIQELQAI